MSILLHENIKEFLQLFNLDSGEERTQFHSGIVS